MEKKREFLYNVVYQDIMQKIKNGEWKVGQKLPTELELADIYDTSRLTIRHALKMLADMNIIYRVKKGGTIVNGKLSCKTTPLVIPIILPFGETQNDMVKGIQAGTLANNTFTPLYITLNTVNNERKSLKAILNSECDGLITYPCASLDNIDLYAEILTRNIPIVCIDRKIEGLDTPLVTTTNIKSMQKIVNRLVELGHKKIAFFAIGDQMAETEKDRFYGFCQGIINNRLPLKKEYIFDISDMRKKEIHTTGKHRPKLLLSCISRELSKFLALKDKPTAICCTNDDMARCLCDVAKDMNIKIPGDIIVTGFDCSHQSGTANEFISIQQDFYALGHTASTLLFKILNGNQYRKNEYVDGKLII